MKRSTYIPLKAIGLLIVFLLNTVIGFACAVGAINMKSNHAHHHDEQKNNIHQHKHAHQHDHGATAHQHGGQVEHHHDKSFAHSHHNGLKANQQHNKLASHHQHQAPKEKDNCCKDEVEKLVKADKLNTPPSIFNFDNPVFIHDNLSAFRFHNALIYTPILDKGYIVYGHHPPIPDIRIAIQSFQI